MNVAYRFVSVAFIEQCPSADVRFAPRRLLHSQRLHCDVYLCQASYRWCHIEHSYNPGLFDVPQWLLLIVKCAQLLRTLHLMEIL